MDKKTLALLALIILLGLLLRAYSIGKESFWLDEAATAMSLRLYDAKEILYNTIVIGNILPGYYPATTDPPVYYITLHYWTKLFFISEESLRFYSAAIWVFAAIFMFLTARELFGKKIALLSSFLFSISIPSIAFSQEARGYMLYLFFGLASMYYLIKALKSSRNYHWAMYAAFVVLGLYTHHFFVILLSFQMSYVLFDLILLKGYKIKIILKNLFKKNALIKIFFAYLVISLFILPIVPRVFKESVAWWSKPTVTSASRIFINFATWIYPTAEGKDKIKEGLISELSKFDIIVFLSAAATVFLSYFLIAYLIFSKLKKTPNLKLFAKEYKLIFLLGWFMFPLVFALVFSIVTPVSIFVTFHYFFYCLPPFIMLLAQSILEFKRYYKLLLIFFVLINIAPLYAYYHNIDKQQWREVADYMKNVLEKNEPVIISIYSGEVSFKYYFGESDNIYGVKGLDEEAKKVIEGKERLWLILTLWWYNDPQGDLQKYINENYEVIEKKSFFDIEVYHYKKRG